MNHVTAAEVQSRIDAALAHHRAGRLDAAEAGYREVLSAQPQSADALHLLGVVEFSRGRPREALSLLQKALAIRPAAEIFGNLGPVLAALNRLDDAAAAYRRAIELRPVYPEAYNNLAKLLYAQSKPAEAIAALRVAAAQQPSQADVWNNLGLILRETGSNVDAIAAYRAAITARPDFADAYNNLGIALQAEGDTDAAIAAGETAVRLKPDSPECLNSLGNALQAKGQLDSAVSTYRRALVLRPDSVEAHNNLANALRISGQLTDAIAAYRAALALRPSAAEVLSNLGNTLQTAGELDEAIATFEQALALRPNLNYALSNLGNAMKDRAELDNALHYFKQAIDQEPTQTIAFSNLLFTLWYHPAQTADSILRAHCDFDARYAAPLSTAAAPFENDRSLHRRLRVGYVSPNFKDHCQSLFMASLLRHHDPQVVKVFCYSDVVREDPVTEHLRKLVPNWRSVVGISDERLAQQIRSDQIDVLVDLTLHMAHHRLLMFARRAAPLQITWLGYPGTTGLSAIDFRLSDPYLDPPGAALPYVEQTLRLPDTFWCYDPLTREPAVSKLPVLTNGFITFGCLNNFCKVNEQVLAVWARVMGLVAESRLVLMAPRGSARARVLTFLQQQGVAEYRVQFVGFQPRLEYLKQYQSIDLCLDTFPYNGHTTSLDALWMGVPVVTLLGETVVGRAGYSQLSNLGLAEQLVAPSQQRFVEIAVEWAANVQRLAALRQSLRARMEASPLMDGRRFARAIEAAYRHGWTSTYGAD